MEYKKIENLLGIDIADFTKPKYSNKKWIEIFDQSNRSYNSNKDIRFKTSQLRNDLCDLRINLERVDFCDNLDVIIPMYALLYYFNNLGKPLDHFGIIIQTCQIQDMMMKIIREKKYFTQSKTQNVLTIKQNGVLV